MNDSRALDPAVVVGATRLAAMFDKSRWWAARLMREWWHEQENGGPVRVFKRMNPKKRGRAAVRGFNYYTTIAIVDAHLPRRPDRALERRLRTMESDIATAYARISELERAIGKRR